MKPFSEKFHEFTIPFYDITMFDSWKILSPHFNISSVVSDTLIRPPNSV